MTVESDDDQLGLENTFPRPGWVVLDAVRDRRFTGEVVFDTLPEIGVYADRGRIYLAERSSDPSLGARLVDAGALNASQLEHGSLRLGDSEHLGRLFERVPSVDRHAVLVTAEMMTEECLGWLASQHVNHVSVTPYRHHPSGAHRWDRPFEVAEVAPGEPLPAPPPEASPVRHVPPPEPVLQPTAIAASDADDDMIRWDQPSWLDEQLTPIDIAGRLAALREADEAERTGAGPLTSGVDAITADATQESVAVASAEHDWIERLDSAGLPEPGSDPLAAPVRLANLPTEPIDRFELIWPSGDIDEQFGATISEPFPHPDMDRPGPTARLAGHGAIRAKSATVSLPDPQPVASDQGGTTAVVDEDLERWLTDDVEQEAITDEVVLAVRHAVASIETGSLAARRRLVEVNPGELGGERLDVPAGLPGRVAVRSDGADAVLPVGRLANVPGSSVFDNLPLMQPPLIVDDHASMPVDERSHGHGEGQRSSALRRLIGSIRRR